MNAMPDDPDLAASAQVERRDRLTELIAVLVLSVAALLSAYSTFQSQLWDGEQAAHYTEAEQARVAASKAKTVELQFESVDVAVFAQWANAYVRGEDVLERFYRARFRPVFRESFDRWIALKPMVDPDAPPTPFAMAGYDREAKREAARGELKADRLYAAGQRANKISDTYGQANVILAMALFLGGITQAFGSFKLRVALLSVAAISCLIGLSRIVALPAIRLI